jgi:hypothetical protein
LLRMAGWRTSSCSLIMPAWPWFWQSTDHAALMSLWPVSRASTRNRWARVGSQCSLSNTEVEWMYTTGVFQDHINSRKPAPWASRRTTGLAANVSSPGCKIEVYRSAVAIKGVPVVLASKMKFSFLNVFCSPMVESSERER